MNDGRSSPTAFLDTQPLVGNQYPHMGMDGYQPQGNMGMDGYQQQGRLQQGRGSFEMGPSYEALSPTAATWPQQQSYSQQNSWEPPVQATASSVPVQSGYAGGGNMASYVPPATLLQAPTAYIRPPIHDAREKPWQNQECAEQGQCLDENQCGGEARGPGEKEKFFGMDTRPLLPIILAITTVMGGVCMMSLQLPTLGRSLGLNGDQEVLLSLAFASIYGITLGCMAYCAWSDPGQLVIKRGMPAGQDHWPPRSHKSWLYPRPIRRYDHYCRWLTNVIGLLNHREFMVMLVGLVMISVLGAAVDVCLAFLVVEKGFWVIEGILVAHMAYSLTLLFLVGPLARLHIGLVSRNETAHEWKNNCFYVAKEAKRGRDVPVLELSEGEFNKLQEDDDAFVYDLRRNPLDRGWYSNCVGFWCTPRWNQENKGDY